VSFEYERSITSWIIIILALRLVWINQSSDWSCLFNYLCYCNLGIVIYLVHTYIIILEILNKPKKPYIIKHYEPTMVYLKVSQILKYPGESTTKTVFSSYISCFTLQLWNLVSILTW
jgi:hypothetical protein